MRSVKGQSCLPCRFVTVSNLGTKFNKFYPRKKKKVLKLCLFCYNVDVAFERDVPALDLGVKNVKHLEYSDNVPIHPRY